MTDVAATSDAVQRAGATVRHLRRSRYETLANLSARLRANGHPIGVTTLSKIERGERPKVGIDDLEALAAAYGVSVDRLLQPGVAPRSFAPPDPSTWFADFLAGSVAAA